jgi:hypothetical protein
VKAWIEQLQSQNFLTAVDQMKGMGALSENEGKKLAGSVAALDPSMSDEAIKSELEYIQSTLKDAAEKIRSNNLTPNATSQYKEGQTATGPNGQKMVFTTSGWVPQ